MALDFNKFAEEGNHFINDLDKELGLKNRDRTARTLKAVMHTLRDMLSMTENVQLLAQLPMFLKAVYVENWKIKGKATKPKNLAEFIARVRMYDGKTAKQDFLDDEMAEGIICVVFLVFRRYVSDGEMEDIVGQLPKDIKTLVSNDILND